MIRDLFAKIDATKKGYRAVADSAVGGHHVTFSRWRHGKASPRLVDFECVAEALGYRLELVPIKAQADTTKNANSIS